MLCWHAWPLVRVGPDSAETTYAYWDGGQLQTVTQTIPESTETFSAELEYNEADSLAMITYGNGTRTRYVYDDAERLTEIHHERYDAGEETWGPMLVLTYSLDAAGRITDILEDDYTTSPDGSLCATYWHAYDYDNRHRLTYESLQVFNVNEYCDGIYTGPGYYIIYTYDPGGNRLTKRRYNYHPTSDPELQEYAVYVYDLDDPEYFGSFNNRLQYVETYGPDPQDPSYPGPLAQVESTRLGRRTPSIVSRTPSAGRGFLKRPSAMSGSGPMPFSHGWNCGPTTWWPTSGRGWATSPCVLRGPCRGVHLTQSRRIRHATQARPVSADGRTSGG
jgi:YD repeat-containing protein